MARRSAQRRVRGKSRALRPSADDSVSARRGNAERDLLRSAASSSSTSPPPTPPSPPPGAWRRAAAARSVWMAHSRSSSSALASSVSATASSTMPMQMKKAVKSRPSELFGTTCPNPTVVKVTVMK